MPCLERRGRFPPAQSTRRSFRLRIALRIAPVERGTTPFLNVDAEVTPVPSLERRCILCLEKDAADASDSPPLNLRCVMFRG